MYDTGINEEVDISAYLIPDDMQIESDTFYLWDIHLPAWEIFSILRTYLDENGVIPTDLLIRLIDEKKLPLIDTLQQIPYIHSAYLTEKHNLTKDKK